MPNADSLDMHEQLGGEDASWLHMENAENPMVINALLEMGGVVDLERIRDLVRERALPPRFRSRVLEPADGVGVPELEIDPTFDLGAHVMRVELEPGEDSMLEFVGATAGTLLDKDHPLWRLVTLPSDPRTTLKNPLGITKRVAWSSAMSLGRIKSLGRSESATLNDVLVSAIAGAIGRHLGAERSSVPDLHAMVPVNLRGRGDSPGLGNHFGLVVLALPVGMENARARLREVKARMDELKRSPEAVVALDILRAMGHAPRAIEDAGVAFFGKKASLVLTNVPGPRTELEALSLS